MTASFAIVRVFSRVPMALKMSPGSPAQAFRLSLALLLAVVVVTIHAGMQLRGSKDGRRVYAIQSSESKMGSPGYASS
jgi:hypothetical protein